MAIPFHKDITSVDGLKKTILTDKYVYRWFLHLFAQPTFDDQEGIRNLRKLNISLWTYNSILFASFVVILVTENRYFFVVSVLSFAMFLKVLQEKKDYVANIGMKLIEGDFDSKKIGQTTLFQLGEFYAKKYQTLSLVDAIYFLDKVYRATLLLTFIFACYIVLMDQWWHQYLIMIILYFVIGIIVNTPFIYKKIK